MASADTGKASFISHKLKFLKDKGDHLIADIRLYVSRIITAGESWTEGADKNLEYKELCQMIDDAVGFLCETCEELAGGPIGVAANQLSRSYCEQPDWTSQSITATAATSATSNIQSIVPVQPADETQLKPVLARIAVIEEVLCSFRGNAEKVAEQQSGIDQQLKELLCKLAESDNKHSSRFRKVEEQISEICDVQDAINEKHYTRLQSLVRQLQNVSSAQDGLDKEVDLEAELAEKLVHLPNQLEAVKENVDVLDARTERIIADCVKENDDVLHEITERIIDECSIQHGDVKIVTDDLVVKVSANTHAIQFISEGQDKKITLLTELEARLKTLEADGVRNVKDFQKQIEKGEANLRFLCQMLNDRLNPLEQLRTSLNERAGMQDDTINKLSQVIQEVAVMSPRLQQLELKTSGTGCGFTACKLFTDYLPEIGITQYDIMNFNFGNNFDANDGVFTAPVDGLYVASLSVYLKENNKLEVDVICQQNLSEISTAISACLAGVGGTTACSVDLFGLKVGDKLFLSMSGDPMIGDPMIGDPMNGDPMNGDPMSGDFNVVTFTCFLLK